MGLKAAQGKGQGCVSRGEGQGEVGLATIGIEGQPILKVQCILPQKVPLVLPYEGDFFLLFLLSCTGIGSLSAHPGL